MSVIVFWLIVKWLLRCFGWLLFSCWGDFGWLLYGC